MSHYFRFLLQASITRTLSTSIVLSFVLFNPALAEGPLDTNLIWNPGFEDSSESGMVNSINQSWVVTNGIWQRGVFNPAADEGSYYLTPGINLLTGDSNVYQNIDLQAHGFDQLRLDTGGYWVEYGGAVVSQLAKDFGQISLHVKNPGGTTLYSDLLPGPVSASWVTLSSPTAIRLEPGSGQLTYQFTGINLMPGTMINTAFLDDTYLKLNAYDIWTWGDNSSDTARVGDWVTGDLAIGNSLSGGLAITRGSQLSSNNASVGNTTFDNGTVVVDGTGSSWTNDNLSIGDYGSGELTIQNGGKASSSAYNIPVYLGNGSSSMGTVVVDGIGSSWDHQGPAYIGFSGTGELSVQNGGAVSSINSYLGYGSNSSGKAVVSGAGSNWSSPGSFIIGDIGMGQLDIQNQGRVSVAKTVKLGSRGTLNLDGGELRVGTFDYAAGTFNWTAGRLALTGSNNTLTDLSVDHGKVLELASSTLGSSSAAMMAAGASPGNKRWQPGDGNSKWHHTQWRSAVTYFQYA